MFNEVKQGIESIIQLCSLYIKRKQDMYKTRLVIFRIIFGIWVIYNIMIK